MRKVLLIPVGIGLAHVGRLCVIAKYLKENGINVIFGAGQDAVSVIKREGFRFERLLEFDRDVYDDKFKQNNPFVYTQKLVEKFVLAEIALYERVRPDIVVFDTRPTVKASAQIAHLPTVSICNADQTPFYDFSKVKFPAETILSRILPKKMMFFIQTKYGQEVLSKLGPKILSSLFLAESLRLSPTLIKLGYRPKLDPYQFFLGDMNIICDVPQFRPMTSIPPNVKIVGPIFWNAEGKLPSFRNKISKKNKTIYLTAAGTGDKSLFIQLLKYLKNTKYNVIATTGNTLQPKQVNIRADNLYITDFLPGKWIMSKADIIIFPGGNSTCYQALSYGVPQICTPLHFDQEDNSNNLERLGTAIIINPYKKIKRIDILSAIKKILTDNKYQKNCQKMKKLLKRYNGVEKAGQGIIAFLEDNKSSMI